MTDSERINAAEVERVGHIIADGPWIPVWFRRVAEQVNADANLAERLLETDLVLVRLTDENNALRALTPVCPACRGVGGIEWRAGGEDTLDPCEQCNGTGRTPTKAKLAADTGLAERLAEAEREGQFAAKQVSEMWSSLRGAREELARLRPLAAVAEVRAVEAEALMAEAERWKQLARKAKVWGFRIRDIESLRGNPSFDVLDRVATALGLVVSLAPHAPERESPSQTHRGAQ